MEGEPYGVEGSSDRALEGRGSRFEGLASEVLLQKSQEGDLDSGEALFRRYRPRLLRLARTWLGGSGGGLEASDVVQSAMLRARRGLDNLEPTHEGALAGWFASILRHTIMDSIRRRRALKRGSGALPGEVLEGVAGEGASQLDLVAQDELVASVWSSLEERDLELVRLRLEEGLPWSAVAERMQLVSGDAARKRYEALLARLRQRLRTSID